MFPWVYTQEDVPSSDEVYSDTDEENAGCATSDVSVSIAFLLHSDCQAEVDQNRHQNMMN